MDINELKNELKDVGEIVVYRLEEWAETMGDKTFFYYGEEDRSISFGEFNRIANSIAHSFKSMGVERGDRISLFLLNPLITTLAMFGMWKIGAIFCPINFNYTGRLLSYQINDTGPKILITEQSRLPQLNHIKSDISGLQVVIHEPAENEHDYNPENAGLELDRGFQQSSFRQLLEGDTANPERVVDFMDTANIIYTSGTTGPAKGCVQSYRWMLNYCYYFIKCLNMEDVVYNDLPLYHVGGAFAQVAKAAWAGCTLAAWDRFSPNDFWKRIEKSGASMAILLDIMIPWLLIAEEKPDDRMNTLNKVHMQPLPLNHNMVARRFGFDFVTVGFGQTESGAGLVGVIDELGDEEGTPAELYKGYSKKEARELVESLGVPIISGREEIKKGFMGRPSIFFEATVLDENDEELGPGEHGQLGFRGRLPHLLFEEYFNKPEATVEVFRNFWFHTGDGVYRDGNGDFYYVDRMGGFIRTRGENISSFQVEDILNSHPKIAMSSAFPIQSEEGLEDDIVVYVVLNRGVELSEEELREWIKAEMPRFMWPKHIRYIDALPQTPTFKVEKYKLKEMILKELKREQ
jgi:crotonobetaine/carnitine-CoA ligase